MSAKKNFQNNVSVLTSAAVPIIIIRTREPYQCLDAIKEFVQAYNIRASKSDTGKTLYHNEWSRIQGWISLSPSELQTVVNADGTSLDLPSPDDETDFANALTKIQGIGGVHGDSGPMNDGFFTMVWPQDEFKDPLILSILLEYAHTFSYINKKLLLIVPETVSVPPQIQDFISILDYEVPQENERIEIIKSVFGAMGVGCKDKKVIVPQEELLLLSSAGAGMTDFELQNSLARAVTTIAKSGNTFSVQVVCDLVLKQKTEMVKRSEVLEVMPTGKMSDIGGLNGLKDYVGKRKNCFTEDAKKFGVDTPKGIALIGPPGTGKSACAKAIGHELGLPVIKLDISSVFNSLVGSSEERVRSALKLVANMSPCIAFLDEVDKAFDMNSGGGDSGVSQRVLGTLLTFLQECEEPVYWIFTANRTDGLPPEMLRKGRLDEIFSVSVPNHLERREILEIHLKKRNQDVSKITDLDLAVEASEGFVAAELESAIKESLIEAYTNGNDITGVLIVEQLNHMTPLSVAFKERFEKMRVWADQNARPASYKLEEPPKSTNSVALSKLTKQYSIDSDIVTSEV